MISILNKKRKESDEMDNHALMRVRGLMDINVSEGCVKSMPILFNEIIMLESELRIALNKKEFEKAIEIEKALHEKVLSLGTLEISITFQREQKQLQHHYGQV